MRLLSLPAAAFGLALLATAPVRAADGPAETGTEIHLTQTAQMEVTRDRLHARLRAEAEDVDAAKAQAAVNHAMDKALTAAKGASAVKAETAGYSVYQEQPEPKTAPPKWRASQGLVLTGADFPAILALAGRLQGDGLLLEGLDFDVAPETVRAAEDTLTAEALAGLRTRADKIASELKMKIVRIKSIQVGNTGLPGPVFFKAARMNAMAPAAAPPPVAEAGTSTLTLGVDATVLMEPAAQP